MSYAFDKDSILEGGIYTDGATAEQFQEFQRELEALMLRCRVFRVGATINPYAMQRSV